MEYCMFCDSQTGTVEDNRVVVKCKRCQLDYSYDKKWDSVADAIANARMKAFLLDDIIEDSKGKKGVVDIDSYLEGINKSMQPKEG